MTFDRSVNEQKFIQYIKKLKQRHPVRKLAIFLDRLSVHRMKSVANICAERQIKLIMNASYSPDYNPVEGVIGLAKNDIKKKRWNAV